MCPLLPEATFRIQVPFRRRPASFLSDRGLSPADGEQEAQSITLQSVRSNSGGTTSNPSSQAIARVVLSDTAHSFASTHWQGP